MTDIVLPRLGLTPSEVIFLRPGSFVDEGPRDFLNEGHFLYGRKSMDAAKTAWAVAFLELERAGNIRFEVRPKKVLLGLRTVQALYSVPLDKPCPWPVGSLEAKTNNMSGEVQQAVFDCIGKKFDDPDYAVLDMIRDGLATRGLVRAIPVPHKILFVRYTSWRYELGEDTYSLATACIAGVHSLIRDCQFGRPGIWNLLLDQVARGIGRQTAASD
jgi:hypothetical protein